MAGRSPRTLSRRTWSCCCSRVEHCHNGNPLRTRQRTRTTTRATTRRRSEGGSVPGSAIAIEQSAFVPKRGPCLGKLLRMCTNCTIACCDAAGGKRDDRARGNDTPCYYYTREGCLELPLPGFAPGPAGLKPEVTPQQSISPKTARSLCFEMNAPVGGVPPPLVWPPWT